MNFGEARLERAAAHDEAELDRFSPVENVASLRSPALIAHCKRDSHFPYEHARILKRALDRADRH